MHYACNCDRGDHLPTQQDVAWNKFLLYGSRPSLILEDLIEEYNDEAVSLRTVSTWCKAFKERRTEIDDPFEWHRLGEYRVKGLDIPWEASRYILDMWHDIKAGKHVNVGRIILAGVKKWPAPTVREVGWWWRVHQALPDIDWLDVHDIAAAFVLREIDRDILGKPFKVDDLEAWMAWRPYADENRAEDYISAISNGIIPKIENPRITGLELLSDEKLFAAALSYLGAWWPDPSQPQLLPSGLREIDRANHESTSHAHHGVYVVAEEVKIRIPTP